MREPSREHVVPQLEGDEFLLWEARQAGRYELHHGFVVALAGGTFAHQTVAINLIVALRRAYPAPCKTFGSDLKIEVSPTIFYYADAGVSCAPPADEQTTVASPTVVCEVLSKSTRAYDTIEKRAAYRSLATLEAYVIVDTLRQRVELDRPRHDGTWSTDVFVEGAFPLGQTTVTLDEIYAGTSIAAATG